MRLRMASVKSPPCFQTLRVVILTQPCLRLTGLVHGNPHITCVAGAVPHGTSAMHLEKFRAGSKLTESSVLAAQYFALRPLHANMIWVLGFLMFRLLG